MQLVVRSGSLGIRGEFSARLQLFLYALPLAHRIRYSKHPSGYSKTESVKKKRRIRSWWPSANRRTLFLATRLELVEYQSRSFSVRSSYLTGSRPSTSQFLVTVLSS